MKKLLGYMFAVLLIFALIGCDNDDSSDKKKAEKVNKTELGVTNKSADSLKGLVDEKDKQEKENVGQESSDSKSKLSKDSEKKSRQLESPIKKDDSERHVSTTTHTSGSKSSKSSNRSGSNKPNASTNTVSQSNKTNVKPITKPGSKSNTTQESKPESKPDPKPKPSGFDASLTSKVNQSTQMTIYAGAKVSLYSTLVSQMANGSVSASTVKTRVSGEFKENGMTYSPRDVQVYKFTSTTGNAQEIVSTMMNRGFPGSTEYRKASVYYNSQTKKYTVAVLGLGFDKMESFD